jgi:hypothetical protein
MKYLRRFCVATILTFTLTFSTFAGDIHCGAVSETPSQPASVTGDMATGATATNETSIAETTYVDPVTGLALDILQSLLSLF